MLQRIEIIGRLGAKPSMKYTPSGQAITSFSVATDNTYTNAAGEKVKETTWFRVQAWGKLGENCNQYLDKGSLVYVSGRMVADKATGSPKMYTKKDGTTSCSFEINASEIKFLSPKSEAQADHAELPAEEDLIPF